MQPIKPITLGELKNFINSLELNDNAPVISLDLKWDDERSSVQLEFSKEEFDALDGTKTDGPLITFTSNQLE